MTKTNLNQKLNKTINQLVLFKNPRQIDDQYNFIDQITRKSTIIDESLISKIFDSEPADPTAIRKKHNDQLYNDQLVYYTKDYNNLQLSDVKNCLYNSTLVINTIISKSRSLDYKKLDTNGYSPIFYAIQVGNYLLIKTLVDKFRHFTSKPLHNQLNKGSPFT